MELSNIIPLLLAVFLGALIGAERETKKNSSVGIRTMSLITLGSCMYTIISISQLDADPTRVIAQIVSGIGFIGGGIIFKHGLNILGLTTAATIWVSAALGILVGLELYEMSIVSTFLILIINTIFKQFKQPKDEDN